jgi:hypothetical protein
MWEMGDGRREFRDGMWEMGDGNDDFQSTIHYPLSTKNLGKNSMLKGGHLSAGAGETFGIDFGDRDAGKVASIG